MNIEIPDEKFEGFNDDSKDEFKQNAHDILDVLLKNILSRERQYRLPRDRINVTQQMVRTEATIFMQMRPHKSWRNSRWLRLITVLGAFLSGIGPTLYPHLPNPAFYVSYPIVVALTFVSHFVYLQEGE